MEIDDEAVGPTAPPPTDAGSVPAAAAAATGAAAAGRRRPRPASVGAGAGNGGGGSGGGVGAGAGAGAVSYRQFYELLEEREAEGTLLVQRPDRRAPPELVCSIQRGLLGRLRPFPSPFGGMRPLVYADWTASGRSLRCIEEHLRKEVRACLLGHGNGHACLPACLPRAPCL